MTGGLRLQHRRRQHQQQQQPSRPPTEQRKSRRVYPSTYDDVPEARAKPAAHRGALADPGRQTAGRRAGRRGRGATRQSARWAQSAQSRRLAAGCIPKCSAKLRFHGSRVAAGWRRARRRAGFPFPDSATTATDRPQIPTGKRRHDPRTSLQRGKTKTIVKKKLVCHYGDYALRAYRTHQKYKRGKRLRKKVSIVFTASTR